MLGQGSPRHLAVHPPTTNSRRKCIRLSGIQRLIPSCALLWLLALMVCRPAFGEPIELQLWIAWGGGAARTWQGEIRIENAEFGMRPPAIIRSHEPVGLQPDEPGSMELDQNVLIVRPRSPRSYDGVRMHVQAERDATVSVRLMADGDERSMREIRVPLEKLIRDVHSEPIDEQGNQILARRAPGDRLRVLFERDSLVFRPGEPFEFRVDPHLVDFEPDTNLTYTARLLKARTDNEISSDSRSARVDASGDAPALGPFRLLMPDREGAFDISVEISRRVLPTSFAPTKLLYQRRVQVVVVGSLPPPSGAASWQSVAKIDPLSPPKKSRNQSWNVLPKWSLLPGSNGTDQTPLDNGRTQPHDDGSNNYARLETEGWQTYWLPVEETGKPHIIEIEYPAQLPQTLGVSVLEPNTAGIVTSIGLDAGFDVPQTAAKTQKQPGRYRLLFWPRTKSPLLLLTNRHDDRPAVFGKIEVLKGPADLPRLLPPKRENGRLAAAYFDRPIFTEGFLASDAIDLVTGRNLNDWQTFYEGASRLTEYQRFSGFNAAVISVLTDGGAIYPSALLQSTPKFDNGVYFGTAQDPIRKDVLEMLFRLFDREGLVLIPALHFSSPLPELESRLSQPSQSRAHTAFNVNDLFDETSSVAENPPQPLGEGIRLVGRDQAKSWMEQHGQGRMTGPYYNPLDPRVQQAMRRVVQELVDRYGRHPSFGGVAIQLGPHTFAQLPDAEWGLDGVTMQRFADEEHITVPGLSAGDLAQAADYLCTSGRRRWIDWRCRKLAEMYQAMADDVVLEHPAAKLYLAGAHMLSSQHIQEEIAPKLPDRTNLEAIVKRLGIDPERYGNRANNSESVVLIRPHRIAPLTALATQAVNIELNQSLEMERLFAGDHRLIGKSRDTGSIFYHEPQITTLDSFDRVRPFSPNSPPTWLAAHLLPIGDHARQRFVHSWATMDSLMMADGGWMTVPNVDDSLRNILQIYQQLPAKRFAKVRSSNSQAKVEPVVVRTLSDRGRFYLYVVNNSPWPVGVTLQLNGPTPFSLETIGSGQLVPPAINGQRATWEIRLQPYDAAAAVSGNPDVQVANWTSNFAPDVLASLRDGVDDVSRRNKQLRNPQPINVLANAEFELPMHDGRLPGWDHPHGAGMSVAVDSTSNATKDGKSALRIRSTGPVVWVRSNPFATPKTGRLAVKVWLRVDNEAKQPPLRLAIEGRLNGQTYYVPAELGADIDGEPRPRISTTWKPFLLPIQKLPAEGLTDLRVGFDLMGEGEVWIDHVEVFDAWFDKTERFELTKIAGSANFHLGDANVGDCNHVLNSYWLRFLRRHVPLAESPTDATRVAENRRDLPPLPPELETPGNQNPDSGTGDPGEEESKSWWKRFIPRTSRLPTMFR